MPDIYRDLTKDEVGLINMNHGKITPLSDKYKKELLDEYKQEINDLEIPAYTQNGVVDMVINYYLMKSKKMNIDFSYSGTSVSSLNIKDRKLYLLLKKRIMIFLEKRLARE